MTLLIFPRFEREPDDGREKGLRDAEGHVGARRIAPLRRDLAVTDDDPVRFRPRSGWTDEGVVGRLAAEAVRDRDGKIPGVSILVGNSERDCIGQLRLVEADGRRFRFGPCTASREGRSRRGRLPGRDKDRHGEACRHRDDRPAGRRGPSHFNTLQTSGVETWV